MASGPQKFRDFRDLCLLWAKLAPEEHRRTFLDMAKSWDQCAEQLQASEERIAESRKILRSP